MDRIGEPALLAHFLVEPRRRSAAEDVIDDIGRHETRIVALDAGAAKHHHGLRHVERNEGALRRPGGFDIGHRGQAGAGRQAAEGLVEQLAERGRIDIADHGNSKRVPRQHAAGIILEIGDVDFGYAFQRAAGRPAIGMVAEGDFQEFASGKRVRAGGVAAQAGKHLGANPFDVGGIEMRRCQRHPQQVERFVAVVLEHAQRPAERVARRGKGKFDGAALEPFVEGLGIQIARALIEQIGDQVADAGLVGRVLCGAAGEGVFHRDQRHGGVLHEPRLDSSGRHQLLDFGGGMGWRRCQRSHREQGAADQRGARCERGVHERFSSRFGAASLIR